ncbi:MAG: hypothetical protein CMP77_07150 [Flavobacterium sp.]|nr:hypothetical protein [Flavobacterium sp.]
MLYFPIFANLALNAGLKAFILIILPLHHIFKQPEQTTTISVNYAHYTGAIKTFNKCLMHQKLSIR